MVDFRNFCAEVVRKKKAALKDTDTDFLSQLMRFGDNMSEEALVDNFIAFYAGGMSNVAYIATMMLY